VLIEDFEAVMRGVFIEHESETKCLTNVKEATKNKGLNNVDHNPFTTYAGYLGSKDPQGRNQCCMATAMEALYVIYNPLWLRDTNSTGKDMFSALCHHFNSCVKYKLTELGQIRSVLSKGQNRYKGSFLVGSFVSCDFFLENLLDIQKNSLKALKGLLIAEEYWTYSCLKHPKYCHGTSSKPRTVFAITIKKDYFEDNHTAPSNVTELLNHSTLTGLKVWPGIHCRTCITFNSNSNTSMHQPVEPLSSTSHISFPRVFSPPHLYFFLKVTSIFGESQQQTFMVVQDWPSKLNFGGQILTLIPCRYWSGAHYRCKVVRNVGGSVEVCYMTTWKTKATLVSLTPILQPLVVLLPTAAY
ncbi:hypothetical protein MJO28_011627, partial [Puccinia striiformis f. sp. tritici]